jgi:hypothetical protein
MSNPAAVAFRAYLAPMFSTRGVRLGFFIGIGAIMIILASILLQRMVPAIFSNMLDSILTVAIVPGIPLAAVLAGEMPLRDGIRQKTLLYQLLGPAPRPVLALVRTAMVAGVLAVAAVLLVALIRIVDGASLAPLPREVFAVVLGSVAYTGLFGLIHLISSRGLIGCLAYFFMLDRPLAQIPFSLRSLSPSYHLGVLADRVTQMELPVPMSPPETSLVVSALVLIVLAAVSVTLTAVLFSRKSLGELC